MNSFRLSSGADMETILEALDDTPMDGEWVVSIDKRKSKKTARQRAYLWLLYNTIANSGKGDRESPYDVDLDCKYLFRNCWFQDDEELHRMFAVIVNHSPDLVKKFCVENLHTEALNTKEMSEYLDSILTHYGREIDLPHPEDMGLLDY